MTIWRSNAIISTPRSLSSRTLWTTRPCKFQNYADNSVLALENDDGTLISLANRQHTEGRVAQKSILVIANARTDFQGLLNDATVATQDRLNSLVPSICETDFWASSTWGALISLPDYLTDVE